MFFFLISALLATAFADRCSGAERAVWFNNQAFANSYRDASRSALGQNEPTVNAMSAMGFPISRHCLTCFGDAAFCGAINCMFECAADETTAGCQGCIADNCLAAMRTCVGAASNAELPVPPTRGAAVTTTARPVRTRRVVTTTHAAAETSTPESVVETTTVAVTETTTETASETVTATSETTSEAVPGTTSASASETTTETVAEITSESTTEEVTETTTEAVSETVAETTTDAVSETVTETSTGTEAVLETTTTGAISSSAAETLDVATRAPKADPIVADDSNKGFSVISIGVSLAIVAVSSLL